MARIFGRVRDSVRNYFSTLKEARNSYKTLKPAQRGLIKRIVTVDLLLLTVVIVPFNLFLSALMGMIGVHPSIRMGFLCGLGWFIGVFWAKKVTPKVSAYLINRHVDKELLSLKKDMEV